MSTYSNRLQPALQNLLRVVRLFHPKKSLVKPVMRQKTCNYNVLFGTSTRDRHTGQHISADVQRITLNVSCMVISGGRTKQLYIFGHITGFMSDFLSFIDVELIWFFHGALQLS